MVTVSLWAFCSSAVAALACAAVWRILLLANMFFGRRLVFLQLVDVDDDEARFGFGIFYGDESGFVSFLCAMGKGLLCSSWGFFFRVSEFFTGGGFCAGGFLLLVPFDFGRMEEVTMNPLRLLFPLLLAAVGGEAEWNAWTIRFVFGWVLSWISVLGLLSFSSVWLQLLSSSCGWEVVQGRRCQIMEPTADGLSPRISCSLPMFGVRSLIWKGEDGGWMDRFAARASGELQRQLEMRKKKHSWDLCVIFQLLRVLSVKKSMYCTAL